jgi:hypothetical protein
MLLPAVAFLVLAVNELRLNPQVQDALTAHLARYPFVEHGVHASVPSWMFTTFAEHFRVQAGYLPSRLALPQIHGIVLPTLLALLTFLIDGQRIRLLSVEAATIVGTCLATQVLQAGGVGHGADRHVRDPGGVGVGVVVRAAGRTSDHGVAGGLPRRRGGDRLEHPRFAAAHGSGF